MILFAVKKNKFYNRLTPAEGSGGKLNPLAPAFTRERFSGKAGGLCFNTCKANYFWSFTDI